MTNKIYRTLSDHRIPPDALPPLWFVEGFAEYLSTDVDAQAEMVMRDAVINNYFALVLNLFMLDPSINSFPLLRTQVSLIYQYFCSDYLNFNSMHPLRHTSAQFPQRIHSELYILLVFSIFSTSSPIKHSFVHLLQSIQALSVLTNFRDGVLRRF